MKLENITKIYNRGKMNEVQALKDITVSFQKGELTAIMGRSGSGKTTLINILGLMDRPTHGTYKIEETDVLHLSEKEQALFRNRHIGRVNHYPHELSGGECQRVAIARALINDPQIIIADEPTGNLDSKTEIEVFKMLKNISKEGKYVIVVSHNEIIKNYADKIFFLNDGVLSDDIK